MEAPPLYCLSAGHLSLSRITVNNEIKLQQTEAFLLLLLLFLEAWPSTPNFYLYWSSAETVLLVDCSTGGAKQRNSRWTCSSSHADRTLRTNGSWIFSDVPDESEPTKLEIEMVGPFIHLHSFCTQSQRRANRKISEEGICIHSLGKILSIRWVVRPPSRRLQLLFNPH